LEEPAQLPFFQVLHVSIPLWFDWKPRPKTILFKSSVFQFHFGSIGSECPSFTPLPGYTFQFHFGSIGSEALNPSSPTSFAFQFHFGSIGSSLEHHRALLSQVSIPLWFDWKSGFDKKILFLSTFQFHFGSIGSQSKHISKHTGTQFQFHFGSIGSR